MPPRSFPRPSAVYSDRFIFTTLNRGEAASHDRIPYCHPTTGKPCTIFTLDEELSYTSFAKDYGPFNLYYTFEACNKLHEKLQIRDPQIKPFCLFSSPESKKKANMITVVALYFLIVHDHTPSEAFAPVAHLEMRPFRDAGNGPMDYGLGLQDILYGFRKAIEHRLLELSLFQPKHYLYYETVDNGDLNILGPFIPFASPMDADWLYATCSTRADTDPTYAQTTSTMIATARSRVHAFRCVLKVFKEENVGAVIRLNEELYDRRTFIDAGMDHVEMYFDDGSSPSDDIVNRFIQICREVIEERGQRVAVHCKAGLGRTGVLIGAYLIYKHQFSASEVMAYMRIVRPGMVVGAQQQYMLQNHMKWVGWAARDQAIREMADLKLNDDSPYNPLATPPAEVDSPVVVTHPLPSFDEMDVPETYANLLAPTHSRPDIVKGGDALGQPRKATHQAESSAVAAVNLVPEPMRGIKRGATKLGIPRTLRKVQSASSLASTVDTANDRPHKRRPVEAESSTEDCTRRLGLSSPPTTAHLPVPKHQVSEKQRDRIAPLASHTQTQTPKSLPIPNIREVSQIPTAGPIRDVGAGANGRLELSSPSGIPTRKSLIPIRRVAGLGMSLAPPRFAREFMTKAEAGRK